ncbi:MAG: serine/threonine-protein kinase [Bryobacteraceae bacterium]|jgi:tetratricopeptide (TPR) repeat protein/predicted Ser/Thr protein kinase
MILGASRKLGKYEIARKLGRGGMADVYLAHDVETNREVALKLVEHAADSDTREVIEAERRGAGLQQQLAAIDPRVVRVYEFGDLDGFFFVAMEYIDGQDLAELMRRRPLEIEFATDAAIAVAETLDHAHNLETLSEGRAFHGIVHGDIKPRNIRIDAHGEVRVLDFGIAKALSLSRRLTRNEFGSVPYASPERLDSGEVNAQSDIWSLAVMLYEMVTGMQPYQAESTERLERMIRSRIPPPPAPDPCPDALRRILMKALANDPAVRYHTAREFGNELILFRTGAASGNGGAGLFACAVGLDTDATRRTARAPGASPWQPPSSEDETRRTVPRAEPETVGGAPAQGRAFGKPAGIGKKNRSAFSTFTRVVAVLAVGCLLYGSWSIYSYLGLRGRSQQLEREIKSEQLTDPDRVFEKWSDLSKSDPTSWALSGARHAVDRKLVDDASLTIGRFRNDTQIVYEKDWQRAATLLAHALEVDPDDDTARGDLRLAEGHVARMEGVRHRDAGQLTVSAEKFTQAQKLLPHTPDPELGLALLYIYGLKDVDKADAALQQAARLGYKIGNREKSELADGYRDRADRLFWDSRNVRGLPQEKEQVGRAASDYNRALNLYQEIAPYGNAAANIKRVQLSLDSVTTRLQEIQ